ncbi:MAG TPA: hypothetical protein VFA78_08355 [Chloroflexota bacterium]|nr:hypothetical protein [Chloroflexota bacterium]
MTEHLQTEDLLDAYVVGTGVSDWERLLAYLEARTVPVQYLKGEAPIERPADLGSLLSGVAHQWGYSMAIDLDGNIVRSFFFDKAEIDFNFQQGRLRGRRWADAVDRFVTFLQAIADVLQRPVEVTPEGMRNEVLVEIQPRMSTN